MTTPALRRLPLEGLRVLDFSHAAAAPFATMFLGDMGAEVIKVEKTRYGDGARSMGVPMPMLGPRDSGYFVALNRNKKSLARDLATVSEMVVQNFRPGNFLSSHGVLRNLYVTKDARHLVVSAVGPQAIRRIMMAPGAADLVA